jgi:hypothetical protein
MGHTYGELRVLLVLLTGVVTAPAALRAGGGDRLVGDLAAQELRSTTPALALL